MDVLSTAFLLFLVLDPVGNIPIFLAVLQHVPPERHTRIIFREMMIALVALVVFLLLGRYILAALQISYSSLGVAGGIIMFLIAVRMIFPLPKAATSEDLDGEPFIVPLAIPLVAGPAAMATLMLLMSRQPANWPKWLAALLLAWCVAGAILLSAERLGRLLGKRTLNAIERLMGLILTAVAVEMFLNGIGQAYQKIVHGP